jgi:hypothetical protein
MRLRLAMDELGSVELPRRDKRRASWLRKCYEALARANRSLRILLLGLLLWLPVACTTPPDSSSSQQLLVSLFDLSKSADSGRYLSDFKRLIGDLDFSAGGVIVADVIDRDSEWSTRQVSIKVPQCESDNPVVCDSKTEDKRARLFELVQSLLKQPTERGTDVLGALRLSAKVLKANEEANNSAVLVVFSDMINSAPPYYFGGIEWSGSTIKRMLRDLRTDRLLPNLQGIDVCVAGAGVSNDTIAESNETWIERFWLRYFKESGAELPAYRYAPYLTACP